MGGVNTVNITNVNLFNMLWTQAVATRSIVPGLYVHAAHNGTIDVQGCTCLAWLFLAIQLHAVGVYAIAPPHC